MNLFRSEEHVRSWSGYDPQAVEGIVPLESLVQLFSLKFFTRRLEPDYVSKGQYAKEFMEAIGELAKTKPFWKP